MDFDNPLPEINLYDKPPEVVLLSEESSDFSVMESEPGNVNNTSTMPKRFKTSGSPSKRLTVDHG